MIGPSRLRSLSLVQLQELAEDIRQRIIAICLGQGGHLGASLGTVEIAIALHRHFESPVEPIVWDVGHQAYAHKLLTGRWSEFSSLRKQGGISGFLVRKESEHDAFGAGHSSTSLSAAMAMAWARRADGASEHAGRWTVAVIGDGALGAGLALEALNHQASLELGPLLVVLNDNQMSISGNVGAISGILSRGEGSAYFEQFGFEYVGPIDGHDLQSLDRTLEQVRKSCAPARILLHIITQKGKGYLPAEERPIDFHGISPVGKQASLTSFSESMGSVLSELAKTDPRILAITAAMSEGTGLAKFAREFPDRFFDVGIAEQHAVTFAAGLAAQGYRPFVAVYSTFLQRALDGVIHDVAVQGLPVTFLVDRAGLVGADGPTHHGAFDLVYLSMIPGVEIWTPSGFDDLVFALTQSLVSSGPVAIRYPRGAGPVCSNQPSVDGVRELVPVRRSHTRVALISIGRMQERVQAAIALLDKQFKDRVAHYSVQKIKPFPVRLAQRLSFSGIKSVLSIEDGTTRGGAGEYLRSELSNVIDRCHWIHLGLGDQFYDQGTVLEQEEQAGISALKIKQAIERSLTESEGEER